MAHFQSIKGRRLGLSSTNGISQYIGVAGTGATDVVGHAQMWGAGYTTATTSTAAFLNNAGVHVLDVPSASVISIEAPVAGVSKEVWIVSSASAITFNTTATSEVFLTHGNGSGGSTAVTMQGANLAGLNLTLRGLSSSEWGVVTGSTVLVT